MSLSQRLTLITGFLSLINNEGLKAIQLEEKGNIDPFSLGQQDICDRFQIPQKMDGQRKLPLSSLLLREWSKRENWN